MSAIILHVGLGMWCIATLAAASEGDDYFADKVEPLLQLRCFKCHSHAEKIRGGLALDSHSGWEKGGDSGPALVPGKPEQSLLIKAVGYEDEDLQMPPKAKLGDTEIAVLREWVKRGAPDPRVSAVAPKKKRVEVETARRHWAFLPIADPAPPAVQDAAWPRAAVDRFILAQLEAKKIRPVADADAHTWLRRVTFDLSGLPPTPEEIGAFIADTSAQARDRVVDRLLASSAFGEKWARHWLDLVGYADELGHNNEVFAEHAWRYRDYVIASFNADKPFDQFIREQVAGDLLAASRPEERAAQITATGFLLLGNLDIVESDKPRLQADVVDQQIEKVGKAFLGMTLNCVRCHDHKFDPIHLSDYYGLAGVFGSTESLYLTERNVWSMVLATDLPETSEQTTARARQATEHAQKLGALKTDVAAAKLRRDAVAALLKTPTVTDEGKANQAALEKERSGLDGKVNDLDKRIQHAEFFAPKPPRAFAVRELAQPADARIAIRGNPRMLGDPVPRGFVQIAFRGPPTTIPSNQSGRLQLAEWLTSVDNTLTARVIVNRIWQKLFGEGLVRSVDYFGVRGDAPSHPELLDHLATRFVRDGWSQKRLIRDLALSRVYGLDSAANAHASARDPDNRLLAHMNRVRLDAESLRDAWLAVSGDLLGGGAGPALPLEFVENTGNLGNDGDLPSYALKKFRPDQPRLRTVYLPVIRSGAQQGPSDVLNFFDFAQPAEITGKRPTTSVPTQALFLLNSPLLKQQARKLADALLARSAKSDRDLMTALWLRALNRPISEVEAVDAAAFLTANRADGDEDAANTNAWNRLCHAVLISNEFLFRQ